MQKFKKRANGKGSVVNLGKGRHKPWAARIVIGKNENGIPIYYDIDTFETDLDALVCLENYHKNPTPLKIRQKKYNRIATFPKKPYPLVPVEKMTSEIHRQNKKNYTFKQVFEEMKENIFPTKEEAKLEKKTHIKTDGKLGLSNASHLESAYRQCQILYDRIYRELRISDFKSCINNPAVRRTTKIAIAKLFKHMDKYAFGEEIIDKKFSEDLSCAVVPSNNTRKPFTYDEINFLWNIQSDDFTIQFVRDFLLLTIYTGCRAEELIIILTKNVYLDRNFFVTGLKTEAGINREIPIHPRVKPIFKKYYNKNNEFLFLSLTGKKMTYSTYKRYYTNNFIITYPNLKGKTAHCGRHALETELQKLNIKQTIINAILGHKNGNVADDIYNHISLEEKIEAINLVTYEPKKLYIFNAENKRKNSKKISRLITN